MFMSCELSRLFVWKSRTWRSKLDNSPSRIQHHKHSPTARGKLDNDLKASRGDMKRPAAVVSGVSSSGN